MNIAQGLKEKNRIVGRIANYQSILKKYNVAPIDVENGFVLADVLYKMEEEIANLIRLKERLAVANVGIAGKLVALAEAKGELKFWDALAMNAQPKFFTKNQSSFDTVKEVQYFSFLSQKEIAERQEKAQSLIEGLQDSIDQYNATTQI